MTVMSMLGEKRRRNMLDIQPSGLKVDPTSGSIGLVVTITSDTPGLASTTGVQVGGMPSLLVVAVDDQTITAVVPTLGLGSKPVIILTTNGAFPVAGGFNVTL